MKSLRSFLLASAMIGTLVAPVSAQVNTVPQVGTVSAFLKQYTYSAVSRALVPAASATDIFCISGSGSRAVSVKRIRISGTAGTLVTAPFTLVRRVSLDTGGTAATGAALPVASPNYTPDPASSAVLTAYTANPTINDSSPLYFRSGWLTLPTTAAGTSINAIEWDFGEHVAPFSRALDIAKADATTQYCINLNAVSISSGVVDISITWTEQ